MLVPLSIKNGCATFAPQKLLHDEQSQPPAAWRPLRRDKRIEETILHLRGHPFPVVSHSNRRAIYFNPDHTCLHETPPSGLQDPIVSVEDQIEKDLPQATTVELDLKLLPNQQR